MNVKRTLSGKLALALTGLALTITSVQANVLNSLAIYKPEKTFTAYLEKDVRILEKAPVVLRPGQYLKSGDVYLVDATASNGANHVYLELVVDWIEPLALVAPADAIRVATIMGPAEAAPPSNPQAFVPIKNGDSLPVGSQIRVGADGCVGLDLGGRHAVCFTPNTEAVIKRDQSTKTDKITVDIKKGAVFSHVNQKGLPTDFKVVTPSAIAAARGTDFVTVALPNTTDVWIQEGTVEVQQPNGTSVGTVSSTDGGSPKILRFPASADDVARIKANSTTLTAAATLIPQLNRSLPEIRVKQNAGQSLTPDEQKILNASKRMHYLIKVETINTGS
ncbi:MAG: FecR family protein [Verrucomicrobiota bacterium]